MIIVIALLKVFFVFFLSLGVLATMCIWVERKASALLQDRIGANRAGSFARTDKAALRPVFFVWRLQGLLGVVNTLLCDPIKALFKEDFVPEGVPRWLHGLAPFMASVPVFLAFAVVPLAPEVFVFGHAFRLQAVESLNAGVLFVLAMTSLAIYGIIMAGSFSNNKFSLLGSLRAAAQMLSYELTMGICFVSVIVAYGTVDLHEMIARQTRLWGVMQSPMMFVSFVLLFVVGMAETKRAPFDLPESESELVAGYCTEYSGMKFLLFWLGEFAEIALVALVLTTVFFGGWHILPFVPLVSNQWWAGLLGFLLVMAKVFFFCLLQIVLRWTLPRFRFDQLLRLGWRILLPVSLVNLLLTSAWRLAG